MNLRPFLLCLFVAFITLSSTRAQDTMRVMHYNLLYYGNSAFCTQTNNNTNSKDTWLDTIVDYSQPHIITVNELGPTNALADRILTNVLNTDGVTSWQRASIMNATGANIINMMYYDSDFATLESQESVSLDLSGNSITRDVVFYHMYYNDPNWPTSTDTVRFTVVNAHWYSSDDVQRTKEAAAMMNRIVQLGDGNYIFCGDLNVDASTETSYQEVTNYSVSNYRLYDPINALGTWHTNSSYANIHTQSTHSSGTGCHAGGGLDDRFDFTLVSDEIINGDADIHYISGSYEALGQDGNAYNQTLPVAGNGVVPQIVAEALYNMSDHLPVVSDYLIGPDVSSTQTLDKPEFNVVVENPFTERLTFKLMEAYGDFTIRVLDISGRVVETFEVDINGELLIEHDMDWPTGVYFLNIASNSGSQTIKLIHNGQ